MSKKATASAPAEKVEHYGRLVARFPEIERKGAGNPYTSVNGNMSSYLHPSGRMALRLPAEAREAFLKEFGTTLFEAYGIVQKEYVTVPDSLLADTEALAPYFEVSYGYVSSLRAKPSKKA